MREDRRPEVPRPGDSHGQKHPHRRRPDDPMTTLIGMKEAEYHRYGQGGDEVGARPGQQEGRQETPENDLLGSPGGHGKQREYPLLAACDGHQRAHRFGFVPVQPCGKPLEAVGDGHAGRGQEKRGDEQPLGRSRPVEPQTGLLGEPGCEQDCQDSRGCQHQNRRRIEAEPVGVHFGGWRGGLAECQGGNQNQPDRCEDGRQGPAQPRDGGHQGEEKASDTGPRAIQAGPLPGAMQAGARPGAGPGFVAFRSFHAASSRPSSRIRSRTRRTSSPVVRALRMHSRRENRPFRRVEEIMAKPDRTIVP